MVDWLDARGQQWKAGVKIVAIDMCSVVKSAIREVLPHAVIVADHFPVVQLANKTLTEVRRRLTLQVRGAAGPQGRPGMGAAKPPHPFGEQDARQPTRPDGRSDSNTWARRSADRSWRRGTPRKTSWTCSP